MSFLHCFSSTTELQEITVSVGLFTDMGSLHTTEYFSETQEQQKSRDLKTESGLYFALLNCFGKLMINQTSLQSRGLTLIKPSWKIDT